MNRPVHWHYSGAGLNAPSGTCMRSGTAGSVLPSHPQKEIKPASFTHLPVLNKKSTTVLQFMSLQHKVVF